MEGPGPIRVDPLSDVLLTRPFLRIALFTLVNLSLAVAAHVLGGGQRPSAYTLIVTGAAIACFGLTSAHRERRLRWLLPVVVGTQLLLHLAFMFGTIIASSLHSRPPSSAADQTSLWAKLLFCHQGATPVTQAQVAAARAAAGLTQADLTGHGVLAAAHPGSAPLLTWSVVGMLTAHLAAAALVAFWLRHGERRAWQAARRLGARICRHLTATSGAIPVRQAARTKQACAERPLWAIDVFGGTPASRRGPPVAA